MPVRLLTAYGYDPDDLNTTLTFFAGKSLSVTGNAFKEVLGENFDSLSGTDL